MTDFKGKTWDDYENLSYSLTSLSKLLSNGKLGLILGAGASIAFGLPCWRELVKRCCGEGYTGKLENDIENFKQTLNDQNKYLSAVSDALYKDITLDFNSPPNKDLLIAICSLMIGKTNGCVDKVLSLNFDCILEWYLKVNGLKVVVNSEEGTIIESNDVEIIHPHGYLPHKDLESDNSKKIILSWDELEAFKQDKNSYLKELAYYFLKTKCFLAIGVSPITLKDYIASQITHILQLYESSVIKRDVPFGFAFVQSSEFDICLANQLRENYGIIILKIEHEEVPKYLFNISQKRIGLKNLKF